jgi:hypothetical protein
MRTDLSATAVESFAQGRAAAQHGCGPVAPAHEAWQQ